jgi:glycosyltransferase involved in cell wall biosynthesis
MMSGVPAITTDYGAFTETVIQGHTGLRCSTLEQFEIAARIAPQLRGKEIRDITKKRFSTGVVAEQYRQWSQRAITLRGNGWYQRTMVLPELTQHT